MGKYIGQFESQKSSKMRLVPSGPVKHGPAGHGAAASWTACQATACGTSTTGSQIYCSEMITAGNWQDLTLNSHPCYQLLVCEFVMKDT